MLELEAEEVSRRLRSVLDRICVERAHRDGPRFCRKLVEAELEHFVGNAQTADERELASCKARLFDARKEADALRKTVRELEARVSNREDLLEAQRLAYMKEIIGLKEALFGASRHREVVARTQPRNNQLQTGIGGDRSSPSHTPGGDTDSTEVEEQIERYRLHKPGLESFCSHVVQNTEPRIELDERENLAHEADATLHGDSGVDLSQKQKISILSARLQSAQARVASVIDEMAILQRAKNKCDKENADLKHRLDFLERFDVKTIRVELAEANAQLEAERELRRQNASEAAEAQTRQKEMIAGLREQVETAKPELRSVLRTFSSGLGIEMDVFDAHVRRALSRSSKSLERLQIAASRASLQLQFHPLVVNLKRDLAQKTTRLNEVERRLKVHERRFEESRKQELRRLASLRRSPSRQDSMLVSNRSMRVARASSKSSLLLTPSSGTSFRKTQHLERQQSRHSSATKTSTTRLLSKQPPTGDAAGDEDAVKGHPATPPRRSSPQRTSTSMSLAMQPLTEEGGAQREPSSVLEDSSITAALEGAEVTATRDSIVLEASGDSISHERKRRDSVRNSLTEQIAKLERMRSDLTLVAGPRQPTSSKVETEKEEPDALAGLSNHDGPATLCQLNVVLHALDEEIASARKAAVPRHQATRPKDAARMRRPESARNPRAAHTTVREFPEHEAGRPVYRSVRQIVADSDW